MGREHGNSPGAQSTGRIEPANLAPMGSKYQDHHPKTASRTIYAHTRPPPATTVIDAAPGTLAPALADAYLRVKATGRL